MQTSLQSLAASCQDFSGRPRFEYITSSHRIGRLLDTLFGGANHRTRLIDKVPRNSSAIDRSSSVALPRYYWRTLSDTFPPYETF
jgi:hypothetical protein